MFHTYDFQPFYCTNPIYHTVSLLCCCLKIKYISDQSIVDLNGDFDACLQRIYNFNLYLLVYNFLPVILLGLKYNDFLFKF